MTTEIKAGGKSSEFLTLYLLPALGFIASQYATTVWGEVALIVMSVAGALGYATNRSGVKRLQVAGQVAAAERADVIMVNRETAAAQRADLIKAVEESGPRLVK